MRPAKEFGSDAKGEDAEVAGIRRVTRGSGLLEGFLARQRVRVANRKIPAGHREGRLLDVGCGTFPFFLANTSFREKYGVDKFVPGEPEEGWAGVIRMVRHDVEAPGGLPFSGPILRRCHDAGGFRTHRAGTARWDDP